jgi:hypothetical protein
MRSIIATIITAGILFFTVLPVSGETRPAPYHPLQSLTVVSESIAPGNPTGGTEGVFWNIVPETCEDGSFCIGFYRTQSGPPVCRLVPGGSTPGLYLADGVRFSNAITTRDMMLFPGFSVPCDVLPGIVGCAPVKPDVIEIRRQAGQSTFVDHFQIDCLTVTSADALAHGWISESLGDAGTLVMVGVTNLKTGENVSRQLWVPGDFWWLYEETPYRRSWRLR